MTIKTEIFVDHHLIPAGAQMADVEHIEFDVRTIFDYDMNFMADRMLVTVHADGRQGPAHYAAIKGFEWENAPWVRVHEHPRMRARVIDGALGLGYEVEIKRLLGVMAEMESNIWHLSRPWWRKALDAVTAPWRSDDLE